MTKEQALEIIKLFSALECWGFANGNPKRTIQRQQLPETD